MRRATYAVIDRGHTTPCWVWQACVNHQGYARLDSRLAHKVFYERTYGSVPAGMTLDHLCRVRNCVNPDHLEVVTPAENCLRGSQARAASRIDLHPLAAARLAAGFSQAALARRLGCSRGLIGLWEMDQGKPTERHLPLLKELLGRDLAIDWGQVREPHVFEDVTPRRAA